MTSLETHGTASFVCKWGGSSVLLLVLALLGLGWITPSHAYYSYTSTEADLSFEAVADIPLSENVSLQTLNQPGRYRTAAVAWVDEQIGFLIGSFQTQAFRKAARGAGVLGEFHDVRFLSIQNTAESGRKLVAYRFEGKMVTDKKVFGRSKSAEIPLTMPLAPDRIFERALVGSRNLCVTDPHYSTEGDFFYFWDPNKPGCPLRNNRTDVYRTHGRVVKLESTRFTYPEYDKLLGDNGNGDVLEIAVFLGYAATIDNYAKTKRRDEVHKTRVETERALRSRGFVMTEKKKDFRLRSNGTQMRGINDYRVYEKPVETPRGTVQMRVRMLVTDTDIESRDYTFYQLFPEALKAADIVIYDGHSGLGANLDLGNLGHPRLSKEKYQIYFFNGCSSYPYFNGAFFDKKGGSKSLDLVLAGMPTYFGSGGVNMEAFLKAFLEGRLHSWQTIIQSVEKSNPRGYGSYLVGVVGDEDNQFRP